jgi:hypothetical protein
MKGNTNWKFNKMRGNGKKGWYNNIFCDSTCGPDTAYFGCDSSNSMKAMTHWANYITNYYDKGSEILPSNN